MLPGNSLQITYFLSLQVGEKKLKIRTVGFDGVVCKPSLDGKILKKKIQIDGWVSGLQGTVKW